MITIVDYGIGNLGSIANMLKRVGVRAETTNDIDAICSAEKLILPGVGAFDTAVERIDRLGIRTILDQKVLREKTPLLGICLGMQLLMDGSDEGGLSGLGWISGRAKAFSGLRIPGLKIPHMGWNEVTPTGASSLLAGLGSRARFYFVHSYYVECNKEEDVLLTCHYGVNFHAAVHKGNILGTQFHPEKSHRFGMKLFEYFANL